MLLQLLKEEILPENSDLPDSYSDAKKFIRDIGLSYEKIDACKNNCMLFWKDHKNLDFCEVCGISRWKEDRHSGGTQFKANGKKIPKKILRYFPLKPRLQRLFMCSKTAPYMRWHNDARVDDEILRHPADSMTWKSFDERYKDFSSEARNVRLGLASDGFQPFANAKTTYSIWPVILIPYNLPPSMCMNLSNFMLSMLIPGPESSGDAIDIYLQPLIDELIELWHTRVETFDTSTSQNFTLRAALLWTINDFPAYANLSGWSTKGKLACPCCNKDTCSMRLTNGGKECYMGHRRYLPLNHKWRKDKHSFDGTVEMRLPPKSFSGKDILCQVQDLEGIILGKDTTRKTKISHDKRGDNWNKKSIFFELPYWETLLLRHNLDVMHIEKNICNSVLGTIMDIKGKTKDNHKTRLDLQLLNIRPELHPVAIGDDLEFPTAPYALSSSEKHQLCLFLKQLKMSDGFCSNIADCINVRENKVSGLKSHDCHILLEYLIPLATRGLLSESVYEALVELSMFFSSLYSKSLKMEDLKQLERQIPITLCKLEKIFPPSFFDIMIHLPIHLAMEAMLGGPVQYRWMYPIEQKLSTFKSYIRNKTHPEASIAEGYIANECISLCLRYFDTSDFGCMESNDGLSIFSSIEELSTGIACNLDRVDQERAHIYILKNCEEVQSFYNDYLQIRASSHLVLSDEEWDKQFINWLRVRVERLHKNDKTKKMKDLLSLARGPTQYGKSFVCCKVNEYKFHTEEHSKGLRTQNSGILVVGNYGAENIDYYGVLSHIIELQFLGERRIVVFKCKWIMDSQNSSLGTKRKLFIAPGSLARGRGKNTRHLGLSGQNHVSRSIEHEPSLVNTYNNDMQCVSEQVDHVEDSQAQMESSQDKSSTQQNLNKRAFTRHLGIIVRDGNICPVRVLAWNKIGEDAKNHMWAAVTVPII
ncbi:uncharacterized protein LOC122026804 [Zingiber officinale]|uniref:uncharacterized protein LOC122026804 n=1 Tax=Zingiber officinale TaxID=94328 RepID=UPI001C4ADE80|nr:uncharacterized protein LOC122026804 [Zingiber officinale]